MNVYFIQPEGEQVVKIGITANLPGRLTSLQMSHYRRLSVIGSMPGGGKEESALHARFAGHRLSGEWFRLDPEISEFIASLSRPVSPWLAAHAAAGKIVEAIRADLMKRELSVKDVAARHGVGTSTIYYLFKGGRHKVQAAKAKKPKR